MQKVYPPLLLLGMALVVGVKLWPSVLLGIVEKLMSCLGRAATILHIVVDSGRLVLAVLAKMFPSSSVYF